MKTHTKSLLLSVVLCGCFATLPANSQNLETENAATEAAFDSADASSDTHSMISSELSGGGTHEMTEHATDEEAAVGSFDSGTFDVDPAGMNAPLDMDGSADMDASADSIAEKAFPGIRKFNQPESIAYYQNRYVLKTPYEKRVDNRGNGYEKLYGVRNFRAVLNGVVYRGGANNAYNKYGKRANSNPLPSQGLSNLCKEGFGTAVYLYSTNYNTAPKVKNCVSRIDGSAQRLNYVQLSPLSSSSAATKILTMIHKKLTTDTDHSPIYLHCWNGWHASGLISAYTLRQFCGFTGEQAVRYWDRNTDGVNQGANYDRLRAKIRAFKPDPKLTISSAVKAQVCPSSKSF